MKGTYGDDKAACSTLAEPLKRRDVEVGTRQKGTAKEQGHGRKSYMFFSLNPLYQIEEDDWNTCLTKLEEKITLQSFP